MNSNFPKITIVTPTYNRAGYLEETILSVVNQNYPNLEYIIIDGGSTDGSVDIIRKYEKYLTYWISEPDRGMYYAIQKGFEKSCGEIMAWMNSDDIYQPKSLFAVAQIFTDIPDIEWIMGMPTLYNENGICLKVSQGRRWSESRFYVGDYRWIQQESVFWKRSLWIKAGNKMETSQKLAGDFDLWCRFFQHAQLYTVSTSLGGFRNHGNQLSMQFINEYEAEALSLSEKIKPKNKTRYLFIKILWKFRNLISRGNLKLNKIVVILVTYFVDKIHLYPPYIYYNLPESKWKC